MLLDIKFMNIYKQNEVKNSFKMNKEIKILKNHWNKEFDKYKLNDKF